SCVTPHTRPAARSPLPLPDALPILRSQFGPIGQGTPRQLRTAENGIEAKRNGSDCTKAGDQRHATKIAARLDALVLVDANDLARDRKSTRLNSSHVKISYAVFCLKK